MKKATAEIDNSPSTTVSFRMNQELKSEFEETCEDMGINMSSAFNLFAKQVVEQQKIPFEVRANSSYKKVLLERIANAKTGKTLVGPFNTMEEFWNSLNEGVDDEV